MRFPYREYVAGLPGSLDFRLILRPVIQIEITAASTGTRCAALVDTGADETIFPMSVANDLGVTLIPELQGQFKGVSGEELSLHFGEVELRLTDGESSIQWKTIVGFADSLHDEEETLAILGHGGFLDYFTAIFDGKEAQLELIPNDLLPNN